MADFDRESMLDMFTFEMSQLLEQLEQSIIQGESGYSSNEINEIFRIMHTIKGSAAMMLFDSISRTAHSIEDLFFFLREESNKSGEHSSSLQKETVDYSHLTDLVLEGMDFIKNELSKIESGAKPDGNETDIVRRIKNYLGVLKGMNTDGTVSGAAPDIPKETTAPAQPAGSATGLNRYRAKIYYEDGCEMENIRAYTLIHNLDDSYTDISYSPSNLTDDDDKALNIIRSQGFEVNFSTPLSYDEVYALLDRTIYLKDLDLERLLDVSNGALPAGGAKVRRFSATIKFDESVEMENVRAYTLVRNIEKSVFNVSHVPENVIDESSASAIRVSGFKLTFDTFQDYNEVFNMLSSTAYLKTLELTEEEASWNTSQPSVLPESVKNDGSQGPFPADGTYPKDKPLETLPSGPEAAAETNSGAALPAVQQPKHPELAPQGDSAAKKQPVQHAINVSVVKLDQLLNLMGELVIAEAMVTQNPELENLELESFHKEARQLRKIINDVQETVMSMRMVPLSPTFFKMHRIVRDMCKQLNKDVQLEIIGDDTEVDKNIIEHISDPLMHIVRNSVDHGVEMPEERLRAGKPAKGTVVLEAKNAGGDVLIIIRDDGAGLNREKILAKAKNNGLLTKPENEYSDKEIHQFIFKPGFSTNEKVTSYSGRGVGMDVVSTNLEVVGGSALVDSTPGEGSTFTLKIPLTLAIVEGMIVKMGGAKYTIPIVSIKQSFKMSKDTKLFHDPSGNEMIMVRGEVYNVVRLYEFFGAEMAITNPEEGIMIMLENGEQTICILADELVGEQQVVVKTIPKYIRKTRGISGCTLLGNGDISLIIDVAGFFDK
ncbi:MAG: chemotaxis protein CheA [Clostridiales bacterium]|jgi:two-component system chemotaxis sensor kinase CheA|nr:chemotaxis protein CheA [Clostridiales bacterium]